MFGSLSVLDSKRVFTNDDLISIKLILNSRGSQEPLYAEMVEFSLVCEGTFGVDEEPAKIQYYESKPVRIHASRSEMLSGSSSKFTAQLRFPEQAKNHPSSLTFDCIKDGIRWFIKANIYSSDKEPVKVLCRPVFFVQSTEMPPLFSLIDFEHSERVAGAKFNLITSHATAGLPQVPLASGIGVTLESGKFKGLNFRIKRLRILLHEHTTIKVSGRSKQLPVRRWLLSDDLIDTKIDELSKVDLDECTSRVRVDHACLPPTFSTRNIDHKFDLNVQLTVAWNNGNELKRISSLSPITVLPRLSGAEYITSKASKLHAVVHYDSAEITDSSDDESYDDNSSGSILSEVDDEPDEIFVHEEKESPIMFKHQRFAELSIVD